MEITDSGKFIEVERSVAEPTENDTSELQDQSATDIDESLQSEVAKSVTASPSQSPGKTVRIKENGAKLNGDSKEVRLFLCVFTTN